MHIFPLIDRGLTLTTQQPISLTTQKRIWWIAERLQQDFSSYLSPKEPTLDQTKIENIIPGMNTLTLLFHPSVEFDDHSYQSVKKALIMLWALSDKATKEETTQQIIHEIPVHYGGEYGPDLAALAAYHKLTPQDVIKKHTTPLYQVLFLGFMPGFVYLYGLDPLLHTPRLSTPRAKIAKGSVGIGGSQTGIYPNHSPGGWQIIGQTQTELFTPNLPPTHVSPTKVRLSKQLSRKQSSIKAPSLRASSPTLCKPGDGLRFIVAEITL